jgi:predicted O-linked N-acetylglucosamine transferase (SPINDLY family)
MSAEQLLELGMELEAQGQLDEALRHYDAALLGEPTLARAHFNRGNILLDRGEARAALSAYTMALRFRPDSAGTHFNIGNVHLQLDDPAAAIAAYREALRLKPDFPEAETALAMTQSLCDKSANVAFQRGLEAEDQDQIELAATAYLEALRTDPAHTHACNNLGGILLRQGKAIEALGYLRRAAEVGPETGSVHLNIGAALEAQGLKADALDSYQRAADLMPGFALALVRCGDLLSVLGRRPEAVGMYRQALEIEPQNPEVNLSLSGLLIELQQLDDAETCCSSVLAVTPNNAGAYNNLGLIYKRRQQLHEAVACFRQALAIQPDFGDVHVNLGSTLSALGQFGAAEDCCRRALDLQPRSALAHANYGALLQRLEKFDAAQHCYSQALQINPDLAIVHNNLALIFSTRRHFDKAIASFQRAIALDPGYAEAYANLSGVLKDQGRLDESLATARKAIQVDRNCTAAHNNLLFTQNHIEDQPNNLLLAEARDFGSVVANLAHPWSSWPNLPDPQRCLRVGVVSGDLGHHPVAYFLEGVLKEIAAQFSGHLELFAYSNRYVEDETSQRLRDCCQAWCSCIGLSDEALARRIRDDGIDILIDLAGHTALNRLPVFAWKPAPVQVSWLGYFATTGVEAIDYLLADPWTLPPELEACFTEQIWRMPETRLCFTPPQAKLEVNTLPALATGYITFGCFNNLSKMNDAVVQLWARVLQAVPDSRLFLKYRQFDEASVRQHTCERFAVHGIEPGRLLFEGYEERGTYLAAYHRVDIALDPFPFPGGTTTVEALWMGVPVLTLQGERFLARQGVGLLMNAGMPEWVAADAEDYVARAVAHASNLPALATLRAGLRQQVLASPIYDAPRFARNFEAALRAMWQQWCQRANGGDAQH